MVKQLHTNWGLLIVLDLCRLLYQNLLIICLAIITVQNANHAQKIVCVNNCKKLIEGLIKKFPSVYQFCNGDLNKFVLLLRKGVYPYEYMDNWERFNETSLPPRKAFYSELNLEDITDKDYNHAQKVFDEFCTLIGDFHYLYVQSDTLLLPDLFENFRNMCYEIYGFDPIYFVFAPGLAWKACLKKNRSKIRFNNRLWHDINDWKGS